MFCRTCSGILRPARNCRSNLDCQTRGAGLVVGRAIGRCALSGITYDIYCTNARDSSKAAGKSDTGLFGNPQFIVPGGFNRATESLLRDAAECVKRISSLGADSRPTPGEAMIDDMDELSDMLCLVADPAECVRQIHPDPVARKEAQDTVCKINDYIEHLNTDESLYLAVKRFMESEQFKNCDEVTRRTAEVHIHDFESSGVHLTGAEKSKAVQLNNEIMSLSHEFVTNSVYPVFVPKDDESSVLDKHYQLHSNHYVVDGPKPFNKNRQVRAASYLMYYSVFESQLKILEALLSKRQELATLVGYDSFAHRSLKSMMADSSENVMLFLNSLSEKVLPLAKRDGERMLQLLSKVDGKTVQKLLPWDTTYVTQLVQNHCLSDKLVGVEEYFVLESCLTGLGDLLRTTLGVEVKQVPTQDGETWDPLVKKLAFVQESDGSLIGYTYLDLYARQGKIASDCQFTIQGGKAMQDGSYRIPIVTISCNLRHPDSSGENHDHSHHTSAKTCGRPTFLTFHSLSNLFHEMGHALHAMLGRSRYQAVTGTRCSTDFAEVPSIMMEYFLSDKRVLGSFAKHYKTGEPLPEDKAEALQVYNGVFCAMDVQTQILLAVMDQCFHGKRPIERPILEVFANLHEQYSATDYVPNTAWFLRFNHLHSYAAKYYSYLWSRALVCLIWKSCFQADPFSRESGEKYREMLRHGGGVHPRTLVKGVLGFEPSVNDLVEALYSDLVSDQKKIQKMILLD